MKAEAQTPSSSRPNAGATAVPVAETPIAEAPVEEATVTETSIMEAHAETPGAEAPIAPPLYLLRWRQEERVMAHHGPSRWRLVRKKHFKGAGQLNAHAPNLGGVSRHPGFPSPSRTVRGGSPPSRSCMSMQLHNQPPHTM